MEDYYFAEIFRSLRKLHGLTQGELSKILKSSQSRVSKIESRVVLPSAEDMLRFCDYFNIELYDFKFQNIYYPNAQDYLIKSQFSLNPNFKSMSTTYSGRVLYLLRKHMIPISSLERFFDKNGIDPDIFTVINFPVCESLERAVINFIEEGNYPLREECLLDVGGARKYNCKKEYFNQKSMLIDSITPIRKEKSKPGDLCLWLGAGHIEPITIMLENLKTKGNLSYKLSNDEGKISISFSN